MKLFYSGASMKQGNKSHYHHVRRSNTLRLPSNVSSLDGIPTLNQWVLVQEGMRSPSVITIECCGLLVGSTSEEIAEHIKESWLTGDLSTLRVCI